MRGTRLLTITVAIAAVAAAALLYSAAGGDFAASPPTAGQDRNSPESSAPGSDGSKRRVIIPGSTKGAPDDTGKRGNTHYEILDTHGPVDPPHPGSAPQSPDKK